MRASAPDTKTLPPWRSDEPPSHGDEGGGNSFGNPVPRPKP
jgi:hypothetical protein